jgi:hypothetical protein
MTSAVAPASAADGSADGVRATSTRTAQGR